MKFEKIIVNNVNENGTVANDGGQIDVNGGFLNSENNPSGDNVPKHYVTLTMPRTDDGIVEGIKVMFDNLSEMERFLLGEIPIGSDNKMVVKEDGLTDCDECNYLIQYSDEDKWGDVACGKCGRSKDDLVKIQKKYDENCLFEFNQAYNESLESAENTHYKMDLSELAGEITNLLLKYSEGTGIKDLSVKEFNTLSFLISSMIRTPKRHLCYRKEKNDGSKKRPNLCNDGFLFPGVSVDFYNSENLFMVQLPNDSITFMVSGLGEFTMPMDKFFDAVDELRSKIAIHTEEMKHISKNESENIFWEMIEKIGWSNSTERYLYEKKGEWLRENYTPQEIGQLQAFVRVKKQILKKRLNEFSDDTKAGRKCYYGVSDDGFWDLTTHIIGLGKEEYYKTLDNPLLAKERADKRDYKENFEYIFNG